MSERSNADTAPQLVSALKVLVKNEFFSFIAGFYVFIRAAVFRCFSLILCLCCVCGSVSRHGRIIKIFKGMNRDADQKTNYWLEFERMSGWKRRLSLLTECFNEPPLRPIAFHWSGPLRIWFTDAFRIFKLARKQHPRSSQYKTCWKNFLSR
jgi:hypothetical protein